MYFSLLCFGVKGYKLWSPETKKVIISRDVTFDKFAMLSLRKDLSLPINVGRQEAPEKVEKDVSNSLVQLKDSSITN